MRAEGEGKSKAQDDANILKYILTCLKVAKVRTHNIICVTLQIFLELSERCCLISLSVNKQEVDLSKTAASL